MAKLYLIGTPLGNLEDMTRRAERMLGELNVLFAEDTREIKKLLMALKIGAEQKKIFSYASHNMKDATELALTKLEEGMDVGFVSDRGMPCISDPGSELVREAHAKGYPVIPIPGPSSVVTALATSGVGEREFLFLSFLPTTEKAKREKLEMAERLKLPCVFFESPNRVEETLKQLSEWFPQSKLFYGREMTKMYETYEWLSLSHFEISEVMLKGEFVFVLEFHKAEKENASVVGEAIELRLASDKEWSKKIALKSGEAASDVYNALQKKKNESKK